MNDSSKFRYAIALRSALLFAAVGPLAGMTVVFLPVIGAATSLSFLGSSLVSLLLLGVPFAYFVQAVPAAVTGLVAGILCQNGVTTGSGLIVVCVGALAASWLVLIKAANVGWRLEYCIWPIAGAVSAGVCLALASRRLWPNKSSPPTTRGAA